jgi:hydrogenase expression/formation protein HypE
MNKCDDIHFMRDLTRGGLAGVLNELAGMTGKGITIHESAIPVDEPVRGVCEMLGFDPLTLANEGKLLIAASAKAEKEIIRGLRSDLLGIDAVVIGEITDTDKNMVILKTAAGGSRILDMPSGVLLPRIC